MEKNYKYRLYFGAIEKYEVVLETDKMISFMSKSGSVRREAKTTSFFSWHDAFEDAKSQLIKETEAEIKKLQNMIAYEEKNLLRFRELKEEQN